MTEQLAFVGGDRQLWLAAADGSQPRQLTFGEGPGARNPWGVLQSRDHSSLPCWSPDGRWMACFQNQITSHGSGETWLAVVEVDGVEEQRLTMVEEGYPIYAQWSPDSQRIALLSQEETHLSLGICSVGGVGEYRLIEEGVPLFFSWTGDSKRLLIHSGSSDDTRLVVRDAVGDTPDEYFPKQPGNFCTPLVVGNRTVFVGREDGHGVLCISDTSGTDLQGIAAIEGLVALVASPDDRFLAFTSAPPGERKLYEGIWIADLEEGRVRRLFEAGVVAYFWKPDASGLLLVTRGRGPAQFQWNELDVRSGDVRPLCGFFPTLDQKFLLHFFEQFAVSHSLISSDSQRLIFASHPDPSAGGSDTSAHICMVELSADTPTMERIAPGEFAVYSPQRTPA